VAEHPQPVAQLRQQRLRRKGNEPRGGQLERKRQPIESLADFGDIGRIGGGKLQIGPDGLCTLQKERDRGVRRQPAQIGGVGGCRQRERRDGIAMLAANVERDPAGDKRLEIGRGGENTGNGRPDLGDLFQVVEQQELVAIAQGILQRLLERSFDRFGDADRRGQGRQCLTGGCGGGKRHHYHAIFKGGTQRPGDGERERGFANAAGSEQADQADGRIAQALRDRGDIGIAPD
jgi:hypothetical protein